MVPAAFIHLSESSRTAVVTGVVSSFFTFVTVGITLLFNARNNEAERRARLDEKDMDAAARLQEKRNDNAEWYRRTLFERQIAAANLATGWISKLQRLIIGVDQAGEFNLLQARQELLQEALKASEWYDGNALFLTDDLMAHSQFVAAIQACLQFVKETHEPFDNKPFADAFGEIAARATAVMRSGGHLTLSDDDPSTEAPGS